jgi:hypothetical protein
MGLYQTSEELIIELNLKGYKGVSQVWTKEAKK